MVLSLEDLAGSDIPGEESLGKDRIGDLRTRMRAEEMALAELVYSQTPQPAPSGVLQ